MIKILFFARLAEKLGQREQEMAADGLCTVADLLERLKQRNDIFSEAFEDTSILISINQEMAKPDNEIKAGDEVAFFPPVTGG